MSWFADLAGKAENLLNNLDEQTGAALRNHNVVKPKRHDYGYHQENLSPGQRRRVQGRNPKLVSTVTENKTGLVPTQKQHSVSNSLRSPSKVSQESATKPSWRKTSPTRRPNTQFSLNKCPKTMVGDIKESGTSDEQFGHKKRRNSLPADLELLCPGNITYKVENLEIENAMLKNELNVMNREVSELLDRLRRTEDGNVVVNGFSEELNKTKIKYENAEVQYQSLGLERDAQGTQMEQLKHKINELTNVEIVKQKHHSQGLETEISMLKDRNLELEEKLNQQIEKNSENNSAQIKLENELRHAQSVISDLQSNLEKSTAECQRLEKDWETYKLRVKTTLFAKDNEIRAMQDGMNLSEDTKALVQQMDSLKEERETLITTIDRMKSDYNEIKQFSNQLEARRVAAERVVTALRDTLKDERAAKNRAETQCHAIAKELKTVQVETGETISSLRTALKDMECEMENLRCTASSVQSTDTSALNVADYDVMQEQVDNDKIKHLTETLVQRQNRLDALLRDNNSLRIQLVKLETKYKAEVASKRNHQHSVVHVEDRPRSRHNVSTSTLSALSVRMGVAMKRHPLFRTFAIIYMVCLHLWVVTVLFTSTPEGHGTARVKW